MLRKPCVIGPFLRVLSCVDDKRLNMYYAVDFLITRFHINQNLK